MKKYIIAILILFAKGIAAQTINYTYDSLGRLTQIIYPDSSIVNYGYDAGGNRLSKKVIQSHIFRACPQSNISLFAGNFEAGKTYKWQVDTSTGFIDITNNTIYSGTNTPALTLNNPPTNLYGFRYRCIISDTKGSQITTPQTVKFQATWIGASTTAWEDIANWSCGVMPDENTDVILNAASAFYPVLSSNASIRSLTAATSASVKIKSGYKLTISAKSP